MNKRRDYPTDLTDAEWQIIEPLVPAVKSGGRPADHRWREIINAIFYVLRTGCQWRFLPHDLPPWKTVYTYFRTWRLDGTWERLHDTLRRKVRQAAGCHPQASVAILDSQSVKTTEKGGHAVTMRGNKWPKTAYFGRYVGVGVGSSSPSGRCPRLSQVDPGAVEDKTLAIEKDLGR
jgi:putative transposase